MTKVQTHFQNPSKTAENRTCDLIAGLLAQPDIFAFSAVQMFKTP